MTYNTSLSLSIVNYGSFSFYYSYGTNTSFYDLLESVANSYPEKHICPCYKIQYYNNSTYYNLRMNEKVYDYIQRKSISQYQFIYNHSGNYCNCNDIIKNNFNKRKFEIINNFDQKIRGLESKIKDQDSSINSFQKSINELTRTNSKIVEDGKFFQRKNNELLSNNNSLEKKNQNQNSEISKLKSENDNLKTNINNYKDTINDLKRENNNLKREKENLEKKVSDFIDKFKSIGDKNEIA